MSSSKKKTNDILKQGTILAAASIFVRMIGVMYRIPLNNLLGEDGNGIYGAAYKVYSIALIVSSYGLPLAVSRMVAAKNVQGQYKNSHRIFINALIFATVIGAVVGGLIYFGADFFCKFYWTFQSSNATACISTYYFLCGSVRSFARLFSRA